MTVSPAERVARILGLDPETMGQAHLESAIRARMVAVGSATHEAYASLLVSRRDELDALIDAVVIPESWFFRDGLPFSHLAGRFGPASAPGCLRILSAPCARGEEAWSIAMALSTAGRRPESFQVIGLDISHESISRARRGTYGPMAFRGEPAAAAGPYLRPEGDLKAVTERLRSSVRFSVANLTDRLPWPGVPDGPFDAIFCRNMLIYLTPAARDRVLTTLRGLLAPSGVLYAGQAEGALLLSRGFQRDGAAGAFAFQVASPAARPAPAAAAPPAAAPPAAGPARSTAAAPRLDRRRAEVSLGPAPPPARRISDLEFARAAADRGLYRDALAACEVYLAEHPDDTECLTLASAIYLATDDLDRATAALLRVVELNPGNAGAALAQLGVIAGRKGHAELAETYRLRASRATR